MHYIKYYNYFEMAKSAHHVLWTFLMKNQTTKNSTTTLAVESSNNTPLFYSLPDV